MPAQTFSARIYWHPTKDGSDVGRDHDMDLKSFAQAVCTHLLALKGDQVEFDTREMTMNVRGEPDARQIFIRLSETLPVEDWKSALLSVMKAFSVYSNPESWEFAAGSDNYNEWIDYCRELGAKLA